MRILWCSLVEFPPLSKKLGKQSLPICGWLYSSAKALIKNNPAVQLGVAVYSYGTEFKRIDADGVTYYLIPSRDLRRVDSHQIKSCVNAISDFSPEIIHIHGTEHSLAEAVCIANNKQKPIIANIQGLATGYVPYADGGLSLKDKLLNITPLDFYRHTFLLSVKRNMRQRAKSEENVISQLSDIIGRTQWDHDLVLSMNPNIRYHFLNETLRDSFYEGSRWSFKHCHKHTIFVSNSGTPLKGAHMVLKALPIVLQKYPDTVVRFCGSSVMSNCWKTMLRFQGYHLYLRRLVKKLHLENNVKFLGSLTEQQMRQAFIDANVYVMPSAIENSPNSLCEAQILGVPTIASYCGGVPTLVKDGTTGILYRYGEYRMLAQSIIRMFDCENFEQLSKSEIDSATQRHSIDDNAKRLIKIYGTILN